MRKNKIIIYSILILSAITILSVKYKISKQDKIGSLTTTENQIDTSVINKELSNVSTNPSSSESGIITVKIDANIAAEYNTIDKLKSQADIAIRGKVLDQNYFEFNDATFTKSRIKVTKCLLGNVKGGSIINVIEPGGITTQEALIKASHFEEKFGTSSSKELKIDKNAKVKVEMDGVPTLNQDDEIIIFAKNEKDFFKDKEDVYCVLGTYQGKFIIKDGKIDKSYLNASEQVKLQTADDLEKKLK